MAQNIKIFFAHRTFAWNNEARGKAAVHCVIIGFSTQDISPKWLFEYEDIKSESYLIQVKNISPYLVDAPNFVLSNRSKPIYDAPIMKFGNQPIDGGNLILSTEERNELILKNPDALKYVRKYIGSEEFINSGERFCLWLNDVNPSELKQYPEIIRRLEATREFRLSSNRSATKKLATTPSQFAFISHIESQYIVIPSVSSEKRRYIPIGFMPPNIIASNLCLIIPGASAYDFGILTSTMHNAWMRAVAGRLESRYRYSAGIVYNNFPWPENPSAKHKQAIEAAAQAVLDARTQFPDSTLADLYDPLTMPPVLLKAHQSLDKAVDAAYGKTNFMNEAERVSFLFGLYQKKVNI